MFASDVMPRSFTTQSIAIASPMESCISAPPPPPPPPNLLRRATVTPGSTRSESTSTETKVESHVVLSSLNVAESAHGASMWRTNAPILPRPSGPEKIRYVAEVITTVENFKRNLKSQKKLIDVGGILSQLRELQMSKRKQRSTDMEDVQMSASMTDRILMEAQKQRDELKAEARALDKFDDRSIAACVCVLR